LIALISPVMILSVCTRVPFDGPGELDVVVLVFVQEIRFPDKRTIARTTHSKHILFTFLIGSPLFLAN
jgi:hypothetical protein